MNKASNRQIVELMGIISVDAQLSRKVDNELVKTWCGRLKAYPFQLIEAAVYDYLDSDEAKYDKGKMPRLGSITGRIKKLYIGDDFKIEALAQEQWELCYDWYLAEDWNYYNRNFSSAEKREAPASIVSVTYEIIRVMGGVIKIFKSATNDNLIFARKDFIVKFLDRYKAEKLAELESGAVALLTADNKPELQKAETLHLESIKSVNLGEGLFNHVAGLKIRPENCDAEADKSAVNR